MEGEGLTTKKRYFCESKRRKANCVSCADFKPIKAKNMCQNCWHKVKRKTNPEFYLRTRYTEIKQRCIKKGRYFGKEYTTLDKFLDQFLEDPTFHQLFSEWIASNYDNLKTPSIDRIDPSKGYIEGNMQWLTHSENSLKDQNMMPVLVYDKDDNFIGEYSSQSESGRKLNVPQANIYKVIKGKRKTAGGYKFKEKK